MCLNPGINEGRNATLIPPFDDAPASFNLTGWLINLAIGVAVAAVFVAAAILTAGASVILTGALVGAAVGAGITTTAINE